MVKGKTNNVTTTTTSLADHCCRTNFCFNAIILMFRDTYTIRVSTLGDKG